MLALVACDMNSLPARTVVPPDSAAGEIAFHLVGPGGAAIALPVIINGHEPVQLILDTGATLTCVDSSVARELELPEERGVIGAGVGVGGGGRVRLVRLDSLRVGAAAAMDVAACVLDLGALRTVSPEVHGLLGLNFLKGFHVTIDFARSIVRLEAPQAHRAQ